MMKMNKLKKIVNFFFEIGGLKRIQRAGWRNIGIKNPDSVAEHAFLTAQIAYILGKMEKVNAERATLIALFHDNGEARIGDANLVNKLYLEVDKAEGKAFLDQIEGLPGKEEIKKFYEEWQEQKIPESIVARDADWLELAIEAKHYLDLGNERAELWIKWYKTRFKTKSAKKLIETIGKINIDDWWKEIPEIKKEVKKAEREK